jgi:hypothetical protein
MTNLVWQILASSFWSMRSFKLYTLAWIFVLSLIANEVRATDEQGTRWDVSLHSAGGMMGDRGAFTFEGRLGFKTSLSQLRLALPLQLREPQEGARLGDKASAWWFRAWDDPETYAAFLNSLELRNRNNTMHLKVGHLLQTSLAFGTLVDRYDHTQDPNRPRTGLYAKAQFHRWAGEILVDSVVNPHLVALSGSIYPLRMASYDREGRFKVSLSAALDPKAPTRLQNRSLGGAELGAGYVFFKGVRAQVESYATCTALSQMSVAGHWGLRYEYSSRGVRSEPDIAAFVEGSYGTTNYQPGYFNRLYEQERHRVATRNDLAKADLENPAGFNLRTSLEVRFGFARWGISTYHNLRGKMSADINLDLKYKRFRGGLVLLKTDMSRVVDFLQAGVNTNALLEANVTLWGGSFVFASLHYGGRQGSSPEAKNQSTWFLGLGYSGAYVH